MHDAAPQGVGIGLRRPHVQSLLTTNRQVDWLEIVPENYIGRGGGMSRHLDACLERWPMLVHGVTASVGGPRSFDDAWLTELSALMRRVRCPFYTDHLCYTSVGGVETHQLLPLPFYKEAVNHAVSRIRTLRNKLKVPIAVENISFYAVMPGSNMSFADFDAAVVEGADCGLLLDVNNLYVNAKNHGQDPYDVLDRYPLERVWQIHMAGHEVVNGRFIDHHGAPIAPGVEALYAEVIRRTGPIATLIERDLNLPPLVDILDEADRLRAIAAEVKLAS